MLRHPGVGLVALLLFLAASAFGCMYIRSVYNEAVAEGRKIKPYDVPANATPPYGAKDRMSQKEMFSFFTISKPEEVSTHVVGRVLSPKEDDLKDEIRDLLLHENLTEGKDKKKHFKEAANSLNGELREIERNSAVLGVPRKGNINSLPNENTLVVGGSGAGKSSCYVMPNAIKAIDDGESVVVFDTKNEHYATWSNYARAKGCHVYTINPDSLINSDAWDVIAQLKKASQSDDPIKFRAEAITNASLLANMIILASKGDARMNGFWDEGVISLLKGLILFVAVSPAYKGKRTMEGISQISTYELRKKIGEGREARYVFDAWVEQLPGDDLSKPFLTQFIMSSSQPREGLPTGLDIAFSNFGALQILSHDEIDLESFGLRQSVLFVNIPPSSSAYNGQVSILLIFLFQNLMNLASKQKDLSVPVKVRFFLDEFATIAKVPEMRKKISTVRSFGLYISLIIQDMPSIQNLYDRGEWESLLAQCALTMCMGVGKNDQTSAQFFSDLSGQVTVIQKTERVTSNAIKAFGGDLTPQVSRGEGKRPVYLPDEIFSLDPSHCLVYAKDQNVLECGKAHFSMFPAYDWCLAHMTSPSRHKPKWVEDIRKAEAGKEDIMKSTDAANPKKPASEPTAKPGRADGGAKEEESAEPDEDREYEDALYAESFDDGPGWEDPRRSREDEDMPYDLTDPLVQETVTLDDDE
jgi:type IV secretion system protein VirD4